MHLRMYLKFPQKPRCLGWFKISQALWSAVKKTRLTSSKDNFIAKSFRLSTKRKLSILLNFLFQSVSFVGSFENEALENEDRSTKHPTLENEAPKSRQRSTQISITKHPKIESEAPKNRKRSTQNSKTEHQNLENEAPKTRKRGSTQLSKPLTTLSLAWRKPNQVEATEVSAPPKVHQSIPQSIWFLACRGRAVSIFIGWGLLSCRPFVYVSLC